MHWERAKVNWKGGQLQCGNQALCPMMSWLRPNTIWARERGSQGSVISHCYLGWHVLYNAPWPHCWGVRRLGEKRAEHKFSHVQSRKAKLQANKLLAAQPNQMQKASYYKNSFLGERPNSSSILKCEVCVVSHMSWHICISTNEPY